MTSEAEGRIEVRGFERPQIGALKYIRQSDYHSNRAKNTMWAIFGLGWARRSDPVRAHVFSMINDHILGCTSKNNL